MVAFSDSAAEEGIFNVFGFLLDTYFKNSYKMVGYFVYQASTRILPMPYSIGFSLFLVLRT